MLQPEMLLPVMRTPPSTSSWKAIVLALIQGLSLTGHEKRGFYIFLDDYYLLLMVSLNVFNCEVQILNVL